MDKSPQAESDPILNTFVNELLRDLGKSAKGKDIDSIDAVKKSFQKLISIALREERDAALIASFTNLIEAVKRGQEPISEMGLSEQFATSSRVEILSTASSAKSTPLKRQAASEIFHTPRIGAFSSIASDIMKLKQNPEFLKTYKKLNIAPRVLDVLITANIVAAESYLKDGGTIDLLFKTSKKPEWLNSKKQESIVLDLIKALESNARAKIDKSGGMARRFSVASSDKVTGIASGFATDCNVTTEDSLRIYEALADKDVTIQSAAVSLYSIAKEAGIGIESLPKIVDSALDDIKKLKNPHKKDSSDSATWFRDNYVEILTDHLLKAYCVTKEQELATSASELAATTSASDEVVLREKNGIRSAGFDPIESSAIDELLQEIRMQDEQKEVVAIQSCDPTDSSSDDDEIAEVKSEKSSSPKPTVEVNRGDDSTVSRLSPTSVVQERYV